MERVNDYWQEQRATGWQDGGEAYLSPAEGNFGLLDRLRDIWQWNELAAEVGQECQERILLAGLHDAGKSLFFNRLRGWVVSPSNMRAGEQGDQRELSLEWYGAFILADLPAVMGPPDLSENELEFVLNDLGLVVYLIDAGRGVNQADFRWVARFRSAGRPLIVVLNKVDTVEDVALAVEEAERRLGIPVIPISAQTGLNVEERLLPTMLNAAPRLAVSLGREITILRRAASRRVIRQAALMAAMMSAQPIPMLDLPFQASLQAGVVMRVGAAYGHAPDGGINREVVGAVITVLGLHYAAQTASKFVPVLGSLVSGALGAAGTLLIGELAIRYYEAGGTVPFKKWVHHQRKTARRVVFWQREEEKEAKPKVGWRHRLRLNGHQG